MSARYAKFDDSFWNHQPPQPWCGRRFPQGGDLFWLHWEGSALLRQRVADGVSPMSTRFFTNHGEQTLFKKLQGVFESNPDIEWFDALVGYLRSSGYFALRPLRAHPTKRLHAKLYIFRPKGCNEHKPGAVITGSSNLTAAGIGVEDQVSNYEFNVLLRSRRTIAVFAIGARSGSFIRTDKRQRPANTSGQKPISRSAACSNAN
jgi:hypothetical protein